MVSLEVLQTVGYEKFREARPYGLVAANDIERFRMPPIDETELRTLDESFDALCAHTAQGFAEFDGDTVRFDVKHEAGNIWARSISMFQGHADGEQRWICISRLDDYEKQVHLLTVHKYSIDAEGLISEPEVGSLDVMPGEYADMMKHFRAPEEATPIATVLSQTA